MHKHYTKLILHTLILLFWNGLLYGQSQTNVVYRFLNMPQSPRMAALGHHAISLPNGDASMFTANPAYLTSESHQHLALSYINHLSDISTTALSYAHDVEHLGTFALAVRYMNYGEMTRYTNTGLADGSFSAYDAALSLGYGYSLLDNLRVGVSLDVIHSSYETYTSSALALSAGALYLLNSDQTSIGLTINNFGKQLTQFDVTNEPLPLNIRLGLSHKLEHMPLRLTITMHNLHQWKMDSALDEEEPGFTTQLLRHTTIGGELLLSQSLHVVLGYNFYSNDNLRTNSRIDFAGLSFGLLLRTKYLNIEFSRTSFSDAGPVTQLGFSTKL